MICQLEYLNAKKTGKCLKSPCKKCSWYITVAEAALVKERVSKALAKHKNSYTAYKFKGVHDYSLEFEGGLK